MGEARRKSRKRTEVLQAEVRCVYCSNPPTTVEHMPPISMFRNRYRPSGFEFAACERCNVGTKAADAMAGLLSRISPVHRTDPVELSETKKLLTTLDRFAPAVREELLRGSGAKRVWARGRDEFYGPMIRLQIDGPAVNYLVYKFGAKLAMAFFREFVGRPISLTGSLFIQRFYNAGLQREELEASLKIMPMYGELRMGKVSSGKQFFYRANHDEKSIVAALVGFNSNLFYRFFAVENSEIQKALHAPELHKAIKVADFPDNVG